MKIYKIWLEKLEKNIYKIIKSINMFLFIAIKV